MHSHFGHCLYDEWMFVDTSIIQEYNDIFIFILWLTPQIRNSFI